MQADRSTDDSGLIASCLDRDITAWAGLISKYSGLIYASIEKRLKMYGITLGPHDIEDIKQDTLIMIWEGRKLENVKNRRNISYWIAIVSGNMAIEYIRQKRAVEPSAKLSIFEKIGEREITEFLPSDSLSPSDAMIRKEISEKVFSAIEKLPAKEKLIIKLNILYDKKYHEIADMLNLPNGTVCSYVKRGKEKLKKYLKDLQ
jgi:RNA polymerase sigma-70 factor (ECF subfamily)